MNKNVFENFSKIELINIIEKQRKRLNSLTKENELWRELQLKNKHIKGLLTDIDNMEKKYKNMFLYFPLPVIIYKTNGKVRFINKTAEKFIGYDLEEINTFDHLFELLYPDIIIREQANRKWKKSIEEYEKKLIPLIHSNHEITCKNNEKKYCSFYASQFEDYFLMGFVDFSDKKNIENKLIEAKEKANKANIAKSKFFANMTHEIKTPMNVILGFSEVLEETLVTEKEKYYLNSIKTAGKNLMKLIDDLLDFSRLDSDNLPLAYGKTFLHEIFNEMKDFFALKLREKNLDFIIDFDNNLPDIFILDEARMKQIFFNIIKNSIQFTNKGHIKISVTGNLKSDKQVDLNISIKDTSSGMTEKQIKDLFNPFMDNNIALGFSISKKLIEKMKGSLEVKSILKKGTCFNIKLFSIKYTNERRKKVDFIKNNIQFNNENILVVDDSKLNLEVISDLLRAENLNIITAKGGKEALEIFKNSNIDLTFLDLKMPEMDGYEVLRKIKKIKPSTKVISITASSESGAQILSKGFDSIIKKPFVRKELIDQLARLLYLNKKSLQWKPLPEENPKFNTDELLLPKEEVIFFLEHELEKSWSSIIEYEDIDEIKEFSERILNYSEKINFTSLKEYAKELKLNLKTFDIKGIRKNLNYFDTFIENFKRQ